MVGWTKLSDSNSGVVCSCTSIVDLNVNVCGSTHCYGCVVNGSAILSAYTTARLAIIYGKHLHMDDEIAYYSV